MIHCEKKGLPWCGSVSAQKHLMLVLKHSQLSSLVLLAQKSWPHRSGGPPRTGLVRWLMNTAPRTCRLGWQCRYRLQLRLSKTVPAWDSCPGGPTFSQGPQRGLGQRDQDCPRGAHANLESCPSVWLRAHIQGSLSPPISWPEIECQFSLWWQFKLQRLTDHSPGPRQAGGGSRDLGHTYEGVV